MRARELGYGWLEAVVHDLQADVPLSVRAVVGEMEGTKVAFVAVRTRRLGLVSKHVALGPVCPIEEIAPESATPPLDFKRHLLELVRRVPA